MLQKRSFVEINLIEQFRDLISQLMDDIVNLTCESYDRNLQTFDGAKFPWFGLLSGEQFQSCICIWGSGCEKGASGELDFKQIDFMYFYDI
jgi:hypothetical protein